MSKGKLEKLIENYPPPISKDCTKVILQQMQNCICKINNKKGKGTGFFCYIPSKNEKTPVMITNNHIIDEEILRENKYLRVTINDDEKNIDIKIGNKRKLYTNKEDDITIIEIKKEKEEIKEFLEIDKNIFDDNANMYNENIYILQYPKFFNNQKACVSYGILINKEINNINYACSTESGSSGSPILNTSNNKVIGIHKEKSEFNYNKGTFLKNPIKEFLNNKNLININNINKNNEINMTLKIEKKDIKNDIYFLDNTNGNYKIEGKSISLKHDNLKELDESNVELFIDNIKLKFKKYFNPQKERLYKIKLRFKTKIKNCSFMFCDCKNILDLDLSSFDTKNATNMSYMFYNCKNLTNLNLSSFVTTNATNMSCMFSHCENILNLDLSSFDTSNATNMSYMFSHCEKLLNLDLSSFDTNNVTNMSYMFSDCKNLKSIDLSSFDTKNVTNMSHMFSVCEKMENLDLSSFITKNVTNMNYMFSSCKNILNLDLSSFDTTKVTNMSYIFSFCEKITDLNISSFTINNDTNINYMFSNCDNLKLIKIKKEMKNIININKNIKIIEI